MERAKTLIGLQNLTRGREVVTHLAHNQKITGASPVCATKFARDRNLQTPSRRVQKEVMDIATRRLKF